MSRVLHNDKQGYDTELDTWFGFDSPEQAQAWVSEITQAPPRNIRLETQTDQAAPAFNAFTLAVSLTSTQSFGAPVNLLQNDDGRFRAVISFIPPDTSCYLILGTREAILAGTGFAFTGGPVELKNTRALWCCLGTATPGTAKTAQVGVLVESLAG